MLYGTSTCEYPMMDCPPRPFVMDGFKWRSKNVELAPNCPRCASSNTKFCYYNNYSLSQPRYFCKGCRRYWTKGGSLRNVPSGGGCRKSRRARAARQMEHGGANDVGRGPSPSRDQPSCVDIDLAAVFANYLSQNVVENTEEKSVVEESSSPGTTAGYASSSDVQASSLDIDSQIEDIAFFEYQNPVGPVELFDNNTVQFQELLIPDQVSNVQEFTMDHKADGLKLQSNTGSDALVHEIWSDSSNLLNFPCQPTAIGLQFQDFEVFSPDDDQLRISSANLEINNWGSFDISGYEIFSGP